MVAFAATPASANVITDWDATGVALVQGNAPFPPPRVGGASGGMRIIALMHIAMFEAVNSIEPRYRPFSGDPKSLSSMRRRMRQPRLPPPRC